MLTLITPTGGRPEAWELCKRWMRNQDFEGEVTWIVVDDGERPQSMQGIPEAWTVIALYPRPTWAPGDNTHVRNLTHAMQYLWGKDPQVVMIEDDDYYAPGWLSHCAEHLAVYDLVGESDCAYFNLARMNYRKCHNYSHASLCATAFKGPAIPLFKDILRESARYLDVDLWHHFTGAICLTTAQFVVGIKGLPGRRGIGIGHTMVSGVSDVARLKALVGEDIEHYVPYLGSALNGTPQTTD